MKSKKLESPLQKYADDGWTIISLGFNCFPRGYIDACISPRQKETQFFDWTGSSLWSIVELLENEFKGIDDPEQYVQLDIRPGTAMISHKHYYLRFLHDFTPRQHRLGLLHRVPDCVAKYKRRAARFLELLQTSKKILFLRFEESTKNRIMVPRDTQMRKPCEMDHLCDLFLLLKRKYPHLETKFVWLGEKKNANVVAENIVCVECNERGVHWKNSAERFNDALYLASQI